MSFRRKSVILSTVTLMGLLIWVFSQLDAQKSANTSTAVKLSADQTGPNAPLPTPGSNQLTNSGAHKQALIFSLISQPSVEFPPQQKSPLLKGWDETATLVDKTGKILLQATPTAPIYSVRISPLEDLVVLSRGNGIHEIYRLNPFSRICALPLAPNLPRATVFDDWQWIDNSRLLGVSATQRPPTELERFTSAERESESVWRETTVLYSFDLKNSQLMQADVRSTNLPKSFTVVENQPGGMVKVEWDENQNAMTAWITTNGTQ